MPACARLTVRWLQPPLLLLMMMLLMQLCGKCSASSKCYTCDNYFELNFRNLGTKSKADIFKRYCSEDAFLTDDNQADCNGIDFDGCVKIVSRSYRYHIDRQGYGMRTAATLIATVITRDCADIPHALGPGCHMLYGGSGSTTEMCYCKGDYCNAAVRPRLQRVLMLPTLLLLLLAVLGAAGSSACL